LLWIFLTKWFSTVSILEGIDVDPFDNSGWIEEFAVMEPSNLWLPEIS